MKNLVSIYVSNLTYEDLVKYIDFNYGNVSNHDKEVIYKYIKGRYQELFSNKDKLFSDIKKEVDYSTYLSIVELCEKYKKYL